MIFSGMARGLKDLLLPIWTVLCDHLHEWRQRPRLCLVFLMGSGLFTAFLFPFDAALVESWTVEHRGGFWNELARGFSYWGDFLTFCVPVGAGLLVLGFFMKKRRIQRMGAACVLGACLAGLTADLLQITTARPRPRHDVQEHPGLFQTHSEFHSFPSGHSATAFGSATALAVAYPPAAIPLMAGAGGVAWSRLYLGAHYPSDLVAGSALGILFGGLLGLAARKKSPNFTRR